MKGIVFQKPFEFCLTTQGESWRQGDKLLGSLKIKNRDLKDIHLGSPRVCIALAEFKKVKAKQENAFQLLQEFDFLKNDNVILKPNEEKLWDWQFQMPITQAITDTSSSPFVLFGNSHLLDQLGFLQLKVEPAQEILQFLERFKLQYRFTLKSQKMKKDEVEVKLTPPDSKAFTTLESVTVLLKWTGEKLAIQYRFDVKKVEARAASLEVKKDKREWNQILDVKEFKLPSGRFKDEVFEKSIQEALSLVEAKVIF